jgi:hypothetical protein
MPTLAAGQPRVQPVVAPTQAPVQRVVAPTQAPVQPAVTAQNSALAGSAQQGDTIEQGLNQLARDMDKVDTLPGAAN